MFDPDWRHRALAALDEPFDLVILGGGITGTGCLLDAAQRGLRVLLVEKDDISSGTSSRSSKLIHGGLRYLKEMQFRVTRLACRERDRLLGLSPHLVRPIPFLYPAYEGDRTPGWQVDVGLWMYDLLTSGSGRHAHIGPEELRSGAPGVRTQGLDRAFRYGDALTDDAALTLAVAGTGFAYGGLILTRAEVEGGFQDREGRLRGVLVRDLESGRVHEVSASVVVNATGHWVDRVRERFGREGARVRPSRGIHLVLEASRLPLEAAIAVTSPDDGRLAFLVPHPEGVLVGSTDLYHEGSLDDPRATWDEVEYLLRIVRHSFPERSIERSDVKGVFAGLRPIVDVDSDVPSKASREEEIWEEEGLLSVAGGKLTTYRVTAKETVDRAVEMLSEARRDRVPESSTAGTPLAGLAPADLSESLAARAEVPPAVARAMARRLGSLAWTALELSADAEDLAPLVDGSDLSRGEVRAQVRYRGVIRLEDLLLRRTRIGMWDPPLARALVPELRPLLRDELGWTAERWEEETARCEEALAAWSLEGVVG